MSLLRRTSFSRSGFGPKVDFGAYSDCRELNELCRRAAKGHALSPAMWDVMTAPTKTICDERTLTHRADPSLLELPNPKLQEAWEAARKRADRSSRPLFALTEGYSGRAARAHCPQKA